MSWMVSVSAATERADEVSRLAETMGRMAAGLALEGFPVSLSIAGLDDEEEVEPGRVDGEASGE